MKDKITEERLTFTPAGDHGNCVIAPEGGDGPYFTLIGNGSDQEQNRLAEAICSAFNALRSAPPAVRVIGLEWHGPDTDDEFYAKTIIGTYQIGSVRGDGTRWCMGQYHQSVEAAQAAAQADFERRILSSLDLSPAESGEE